MLPWLCVHAMLWPLRTRLRDSLKRLTFTAESQKLQRVFDRVPMRFIVVLQAQRQAEGRWELGSAGLYSGEKKKTSIVLFFPPNFPVLCLICSIRFLPIIRLCPSRDSYQPGSPQAMTCFLRSLWGQLIASSWTAARATPEGDVTHSEDNAIRLLSCAWAHIWPWLTSLAVIDKEEREYSALSPLEHRMSSRPQVAMASPGFGPAIFWRFSVFL